MAPPNPPSTGGSFADRLTRKVGPLPVWAWAAVILTVGYLIYRRSGGGAAAQTTTAPLSTSTSGTDTGAVSGGGGSGTPSSNLTPDLFGHIYDANVGTIDALTNAIVNQSALAASSLEAGGPPGAVSQSGAASAPTVNAPGGAATPPAVKVGGSTAHETQTAPGSLSWGGKTFTTKAGFDAWATQHKTTTKAELANHPQARQIYGTLK